MLWMAMHNKYSAYRTCGNLLKKQQTLTLKIICVKNNLCFHVINLMVNFPQTMVTYSKGVLLTLAMMEHLTALNSLTPSLYTNRV